MKSKVKYTNKYSRKGRVLISKKGIVQKKNVQKMIRSIAHTKYSDDADENKRIRESEKAELKDYIAMRQRSSGYKSKQLTISGYEGHRLQLAGDYNTVDVMFANMGYSTEEIASMYGISVDALRDESNWDGDDFIYGETVYRLHFNYEGKNVFEEVSYNNYD